MSDQTMKEILEKAREIYDETIHGAAGCCGDFAGAMEYIDGAVGELIQQVVNIVVDRDLIDGLFRIGLNPLGNVVMRFQCWPLWRDLREEHRRQDPRKSFYRLRAAHKCEKSLATRTARLLK